MNILTFVIGGTYIKYALMNEKSEFLFKDRVETPQSSRAELIDTLVDVYGKYDEINGIAISMPGIIDRQNGYCRIGGALTYNNDFFLRDALHEKCPVPTVMENDAKCAAMAEASFGALKDVNDGFVLIFGTMIGGGISEEPVFMETLRKHLNEIYEKCPYSIPHAEVVTCAFSNDANLIGALSCWLEDN